MTPPSESTSENDVLASMFADLDRIADEDGEGERFFRRMADGLEELNASRALKASVP